MRAVGSVGANIAAPLPVQPPFLALFCLVWTWIHLNKSQKWQLKGGFRAGSNCQYRALCHCASDKVLSTRTIKSAEPIFSPFDTGSFL